MSYSVMELFEKTTRAQGVVELVEVVTGAASPTEAETRAKDLEYPNDLVRETRLLALAKRDHEVAFQHYGNFFAKNKEIDPWRYFDCIFTRASLPVYEEHGILAIKPQFPLPPLFWTYALFNADGEKLFSLEDGTPVEQGYSVVINGSSKSIPVGLKMCVWAGSSMVEFSLIDPVYRKMGVWRVHTQGWPTGSEYLYWMEGNNAHACFRPIMDEDKRGRGNEVAPERYVLEIVDFEKRHREIDKEKRWRFEKYAVQGLYFFVSPWENMDRFSQLGGKQISRGSTMHHGMNEVISVTHTFSGGGVLQKQLPRPIEEVVSTMIYGMPWSIRTLPTLHNLFSFKHASITCYNVDGHDAPLVAL